MRRKVLLIVVALLFSMTSFSQAYKGMSGLIHVPTADMHAEGEARMGAHFLHRQFTPNGLTYHKEKYHTMSYFVSVTPFQWLEMAYTGVLMKGNKTVDHKWDKAGYYHKDQHFSVKIQLLREKPDKWWPSIAVGMDDPYSKGLTVLRHEPEIMDGVVEEESEEKVLKDTYFANTYLALSKHFDWAGNYIGVHVAFRDWYRIKNEKWNGLVGGITFQPSFQQNLRLIAEYTGDDVNVGLDWKLWKHWLVQASLQNGKYVSGGICFCLPLL